MRRVRLFQQQQTNFFFRLYSILFLICTLSLSPTVFLLVFEKKKRLFSLRSMRVQ